MEDQNSNNINGKANDIEATPSHLSTEEESKCWRTFLALFCCTKPPLDGAEPVTTKHATHDSQRSKKKTTKKDNASKSDEETASVDDLFGKQWFGYSRKKSKKGNKAVNLDEIGEVKAIDNNVLKAKIGIKQRDKRPPTAGHMKRMISSDIFDNLTPISYAEVPPSLVSDIKDGPAATSEVETINTNGTAQEPSNDIQMTNTSHSSDKETEPKTTSNDEDTEKSKKSPDDKTEQNEIESQTTASYLSSNEATDLVATTSKAKDITLSEAEATTLTQVIDTKSPEARAMALSEAQFTTLSEANVSTTATEAKVSTPAEANGTATSNEGKASTTSVAADVTTTSAEVKSSPEIKDNLSSDADRKGSSDPESNESKLQSNDVSLVKETDKSPTSDVSVISDQVLQEPDKRHSTATTEDKSSTGKDEKSAGKLTEQTVTNKHDGDTTKHKIGMTDIPPLEDVTQLIEKKAIQPEMVEEVTKAKPGIAKKPSLGANKTPSVSRELSTDSIGKPGKIYEDNAESEVASNEPKRHESNLQLTAEEKKHANNDDSQPTKDAQPAKDAQPTKDAQPEKDAQPSKDTQPAKDAQPTKDAQPEKYAQTSKDSQPAKDAQPTKDAQPIKDAQPAEDAQSKKDAQSAEGKDTTAQNKNTDLFLML